MDSVEALIRKQVAQLSQETVAGRADMKPCTVSRILSGAQGVPLEKIGIFLSAVGLEVMANDGDEVLVQRDRLRALTLLAKSALEGGE